jgi:glutathione S-transferase
MLQLLIDSEATAVHLAKKFGVPDSLIRSAEQRKQIAAIAQQMAQQQQQQQQMGAQVGGQPV